MKNRIAPAGRVAPARQVAFDLLLELRQKPQSHSDTLLHSRRADALSPVDKNLLTALVMGVLRWKTALDARISGLRTGAKDPLEVAVEIALELGALQLLLLDRIPPHAAVFESVELVKQSGNGRAAGLVNAILRKLIGAPKLTTVHGAMDSPEQIARMWAHPLWMVERWVRDYGLESASAICGVDQFPPPTVIRLLDPGAEAALQAQGVQLEAGTFVKMARRVIAGDVSAIGALSQGPARGHARIQDEGSQLIAEVAADGGSSLSSLPVSILDCCAAPGGKTAILAEQNPEASICACEIHPGRLKAMRGTLARQARSGRIAFRLADIAQTSFEGLFDLVLCDVPCSGTGTLARNPEIRHRIVTEDFALQRDRQIRILRSAMKAVAPGGQLVYATCSLEREENDEVVDAGLASQKGFRLVPFRDRIEELEARGILHAGSAKILFAHGVSGEFLRTIPGIHPCDGFFGAVLRRET